MNLSELAQKIADAHPGAAVHVDVHYRISPWSPPSAEYRAGVYKENGNSRSLSSTNPEALIAAFVGPADVEV